MAKFFKRKNEQAPKKSSPLDLFNVQAADLSVFPAEVTLDGLIGFSDSRISKEELLVLFKQAGVQPRCFTALLRGINFSLKNFNDSPTIKPEMVKVLSYLHKTGLPEAIQKAKDVADQEKGGQRITDESGMSGAFYGYADILRAEMKEILQKEPDQS